MTPSLAAQAYDTVEAMIVTLKLPPGTVFSEAELREQVGFGRTPLREALQRLTSDRLLVTMPRRGMMVTAIDLVDFHALLETRRALDGLIAARAARRATPIQHEAFAAQLDAMQQAAAVGDLDAFMLADRAADEVLAAAAQNPFAAQAVAPLHAHCRRFWYAHQHNGDLARSADLHQHVLAAVRARDPRMAEAATDTLIDYLDAFRLAVATGIPR